MVAALASEKGKENTGAREELANLLVVAAAKEQGSGVRGRKESRELGVIVGGRAECEGSRHAGRRIGPTWRCRN